MKKYFIFFAAVLMSLNLFAEEATVAFEGNGRTKVMTVTLPYTFSCDYSSENGELDGIIQELYELSDGGYCNGDVTPVRTGNTMVSAGKNGSNQYITVDDVFDGKAVVSGKYYKRTGSEIGSESIDYKISITIWEGNAVAFSVYSSWENDNTTLSTSDFPNFLVIPEVKAQTLKITDSEIIYVIYDITGNGDVKCAVYNDGSYVGLETLTNSTRASFYALSVTPMAPTFYYSFALTPVTPATPVISGDKYFVESNTVTIDCASKGAVIYYTLNGENPAHNPYCPVYEDPFEITEPTTVRAVSYNGDQWSNVAMMEFKQGERVVFVANGNRKEVVVPIPHTFSCDYNKENDELDAIIQELYELPSYGGYCDKDATPMASGNAAVTAGKNGYNHYITVSNVFDGTATVSGVYKRNISELESEPFDYSLTIYMKDDITLTDNADNSSIIDSYNDMTVSSVTLQGRTLYKDGNWNTLCLPFDVEDGDNTDELTFSGTPLEGATVMELDITGTYEGHQTGLANDGTLYLYFKTAETIEAGKPYLVCWGTPENPAGGTIENPVFNTVTITSTAPTPVTSSDGKVSFKGNYDPVTLEKNDQTSLYLGTNNTLYWPSKGDKTINAFRAYFKLNSNTLATAFVLNFGGEETTGITNTDFTDKDSSDSYNSCSKDNAWFTLDGRKLNDKPTQKGIYIRNSKKIIIK